jgi:RHS repeat-associated protein
LGRGYFLSNADHLNTPRLVADATGTTVWRWDQSEPFGNNPADENPSSLGTFDLPLRLPGQYFDKETNLYYNYFRDYDPSLGRFGESDPIGLRGGLNTYAYVAARPLSLADAMGLQTAPGIPIPLPPITIPGTPANQSWVSSFNRLIKKIKDACTPRGKCRLYDAVWDYNPKDLYIDPSSPKPIMIGGIIKCFYRCDSGDHRVIQWPSPPGRMTQAQAMAWCDQEFDE